MDSVAFSHSEGLPHAQLPEQQQQAVAHPSGFAEGVDHRGRRIQKVIRAGALGIGTLGRCQAELLLLRQALFIHSTGNTSATPCRRTAHASIARLQGRSLGILCSSSLLPGENDSLG